MSEYENFQPSTYNKLHARFLRLAGGEGQSAVEGTLAALLQPHMQVFDAGCGTGLLARRLIGTEPGIDLTMLDASPRLLRATRDLPARRIHGDVLNLPLPDGIFDLSLALWIVEATRDPGRALEELVRVTRKGGHICVLFCAEMHQADLIDRAMKWGLRLRGTGRFLQPREVKARLLNAGVARIRELRCRGPAAAFLVKN